MENQEMIVKVGMVTMFLVLMSFGIRILISHVDEPTVCGNLDIFSCTRSQ